MKQGHTRPQHPIEDGHIPQGGVKGAVNSRDRADNTTIEASFGSWNLIYYGNILISPIAAVPMSGEAQVLPKGHAVTTLLASKVAMTATSVSFGRMARVYPSAGSVHTYVSRGFNPHIGFVLGWAMFLEYLFQPMQNSLYAGLKTGSLTAAPMESAFSES